MSHNQFQFIGNLTREVATRKAANGKTVADIDIAVNESWTDKETNEKKEKVNYFRITAWGKTAENAAQYLGKGSSVFVQGQIENNNYDKGGEMVYSFQFVADTVRFLSKKKEDENQ